MKKKLFNTCVIIFFILIHNEVKSDNFDKYFNDGKINFNNYLLPNQNFSEKFNFLNKSIENFEKAYKINPNHQILNYFLGYAYDSKIMGESPGDSIIKYNYNLAKKVSSFFQKAINKKNGYQGDMLTLSPYSKITSIYGSAAMSYLYKDNLDSAIISLKEGKANFGFEDAYLEYVKNILNQCDSNSILITWGDNDTFPFYYLQLVNNFRKDVLVINYNLISTLWACEVYFSSNYFNNYGIEFKRSLLYEIYNETPKELDIPDKVEFRLNDVANNKYQINENSFIIKLNPLKVDSIPTLYFQDIIFLELLKKNNWNRRIYLTFYDENILFTYGLNNSVINKGLISEIVPKIIKNEDKIDFNFIYKEIISKRNIEFIKTKKEQISKDFTLVNLIYNYELLYLMAANYFSTISYDKNKLNNVLKEFNKNYKSKFPTSKNLKIYWDEIQKLAKQKN